MYDEDLKELKGDVKELVKQGAVHNELLRTHEARSLELSARQDTLSLDFGPIKAHVRFVDGVLKVLGVALVGGLVQAAIRYFI